MEKQIISIKQQLAVLYKDYNIRHNELSRSDLIYMSTQITSLERDLNILIKNKPQQAPKLFNQQQSTN